MLLRHPRSLRHSNRCGAVLVLFGFFAFILAGIAALTIDIGIARLSQVQMQTATDSAALEGLRGRDAPQSSADLNRRQSAAQMMTWTFDDDFAPEDGDPLQLGAGPTIALTGGFGNSSASQFLDLSSSGVYKPRPELNLTDQPYGDLVAGDPLFATEPAGALEDSAYTRADFVNEDLDGNGRPDAFLARLRRTNDVQGLDQVPGVSTKGPPLPYLFGLASFLTSSTGGEVVDRGITVRATSIAAAGRVMDAQGNLAQSVGIVLAVGPEDPASGRAGAAPLAVDRSFFANTLASGAPVALAIDGTGTITFGGARVGLFAVVSKVGESVLAGSIPSAIGARVYVPVFDTVAGRQICVGFGCAAVDGFDSSTLTFTKLDPFIAPQNASALLPSGLVGLSPAELADVLQARAEFDRWSLRAPVLIR